MNKNYRFEKEFDRNLINIKKHDMLADIYVLELLIDKLVEQENIKLFKMYIENIKIKTLNL